MSKAESCLTFEAAKELIRKWDRSVDDSAAKAALVERYPFLNMQPWYQAEDDDCNVAVMSFMPDGWRIALGAEMFEDLRTILLKTGGVAALNSYQVEQVSEKYGELRWHSRCPDNVGDDSWRWINRVEELYCSITGRTCIVCGSMEDVKLTAGWVSPFCRKEGELAFTELEPITREGEFCVWTHRDGDVETQESYKDLCVGSDAPILTALRLNNPLMVTMVWEMLCDAQEG